jgi:leucyl-tRNA synthetase
MMVLDPVAKGNASDASVKALRRKTHQTLKAVTRDFEKFEFNTIISGLMELLNEMTRLKVETYGSTAWNESVEIYLKMLAPVAPHISEELWEKIGKPYSIHTQAWPKVDEAAAKQDEITLVVQINGKVRDRVLIAAECSDEEAKKAALTSELVQKSLEGNKPKQVIYVKGRLVNIVL